MTDESHFETALDLHPDNWACRLVYADWLAEQGDERRAAGQRWQARRRITVGTREGDCIWKCSRWRFLTIGVLPNDIFDAMWSQQKGEQNIDNHRIRWIPCSSRRAAELLLADVLWELAAEPLTVPA